ncbi:MAG: hypothetical protein WC679_01865 [Bacteroidales bacterium]|jgi:hypothetical protein
MAGKQLCSKEGFEKYLTQDITLQLKNDITKTVKFLKDLNPKNATWYFVESGNEVIKIHHSELSKPGRENFIRIKPQNVGLVGYFETPFLVAETVYNSLDNLDDFNRLHIIKLLCKFNKKFANKHHSKYKNINLANYSSSINNITIAKDFGEVLGALWIDENDIDFPKEHNFPLYDYSINGIKYSAKTNKSSNTVKLAHISELIGPDNQNHWLANLINDYVACIKTNGVKRGNLIFENSYKEICPSELSGCRYWRDLSNQNLGDITNFYNNIISSEIKNIVTTPNKGDFLIEVKVPRMVKIKLKEYIEQLGLELYF